MNIRPDAVTVLCYGDSNTWGQKPDKSGRYPAGIRWTGVLQKNLGDNYYIIEEGLNSRTTDLEYSRKPGRNGRAYLTPCLASHNPLDVVILMLGTNDLKIEFDRSALQIAAAVKGLVGDVKSYAWNKQKTTPEIIVVSPVLVNSQAVDFEEFYLENYNEESAQKSCQLAGELAKITKETNCLFIDAAAVAQVGTDGIHFDEASHPALGALIANRIKHVELHE